MGLQPLLVLDVEDEGVRHKRAQGFGKVEPPDRKLGLVVSTQHIYLPQRRGVAGKRKRIACLHILFAILVVESRLCAQQVPRAVDEQAQFRSFGLQPIMPLRVIEVDHILGQKGETASRK